MENLTLTAISAWKSFLYLSPFCVTGFQTIILKRKLDSKWTEEICMQIETYNIIQNAQLTCKDAYILSETGIHVKNDEVEY